MSVQSIFIVGGTQGGQIICLHGVGFLREKISVTICGEICPLLPDRSSTTELCCVIPPVQGTCIIQKMNSGTPLAPCRVVIHT